MYWSQIVLHQKYRATSTPHPPPHPAAGMMNFWSHNNRHSWKLINIHICKGVSTAKTKSPAFTGQNSPYENRHPHILAVLVDMSPRVLDDLPLCVGQGLGALRTIVALHLPSSHPQHLWGWRWRGRRRRLPARHPPAAQQPGGSQQGSGEIGSEGGGDGDGELRPHGGSWERRVGVRRGAERRKKRGGEGGEEADSPHSQKKKKDNGKWSQALTPNSPSFVLPPNKNLFLTHASSFHRSPCLPQCGRDACQ